MVEAQSYTTRRSSNPRFEISVDIPITPTGEVRYGTSNNIFTSSSTFISPFFNWLLHLRYLPVSFNQAIGATTPFFTVIFAFLITCKKKSKEVYFALMPVVFGIVLARNSEPLFHLFGFMMCVGSTAGRALKSVVQGLLLTSDNEKLHSMNLLLYMAPMVACILLPFSFYIEGDVFGKTVKKAKSDWFMVFLLIGNATVAYCVNLTNFLVTKHTSALTLQVLGNAKAAVVAVVSVLIFRNPVTVMGIFGFGVTIMGVVLYTEARRRGKVTVH
ncbi:probable sugar phosphate/phosphate translocator [Tanacetum coccineum]